MRTIEELIVLEVHNGRMEPLENATVTLSEHLERLLDVPAYESA